jgi:hypothetical protein
MAMPFDTLKLARRLEAVSQLATKADLRDLEHHLTIRLGGMIVSATGVLLAAKYFG